MNAIQPQVVARPAPVAAAPAAQPQPTVPAPASAGGFGPVATTAPVATTNGAAAPATPPASAGGFGPAAPAQQGNVAQPAKPAVQMTGFGGVVQVPSQVTPAPATVHQAPVTPGVVSAFEGSIDDRLNALLGE